MAAELDIETEPETRHPRRPPGGELHLCLLNTIPLREDRTRLSRRLALDRGFDDVLGKPAGEFALEAELGADQPRAGLQLPGASFDGGDGTGKEGPFAPLILKDIAGNAVKRLRQDGEGGHADRDGEEDHGGR